MSSFNCRRRTTCQYNVSIVGALTTVGLPLRILPCYLAHSCFRQTFSDMGARTIESAVGFLPVLRARPVRAPLMYGQGYR
jgi:hypothetical protein